MARSSETIDDGSFGDGDLPGGGRMFRRGAEVGRWIVLDRVGAGAMGVVLAAFDPQLDRKVALKFLFARPQNERELDLVRDMQALARLSHPNVVAVHEVGIIEDHAFVAMEFVAGQTLRRWLAEEQRPWSRVLDVFTAAGRGLAAVHAAGLVHRDVKPDNIMIGPNDDVRVMDFGAHVGTPAYTSPEQHAGLPADARSDQFAFCVALYEALYRRRPFSGASLPELVRNVRAGATVPEPSDTAVPASIRAVLQRGLAADPAARFTSMDELLAALERDPDRGRRRWIAGAIVGAAVLVGAIAFEVADRRRVAACTIAAGEIGEVWNDATRSSLREGGAARVDEVERRLDDYATAWRETAATVCHAGRVEGSFTLEQRDRSERCLARGKERFAAIVEVLSEADPTAAEPAIDAAAGLRPVVACADPQAGDAVANNELRRTLDRAHALAAAGKREAALAQLEQLGVPDEPRLHAEARALQGELEHALALDDDAAASFEAAFFEASRAGDDPLVARAAIGLALVASARDARSADALRWIRHAEAALERQGGDPLLTANVHEAHGTVLARRGDRDDAEAELRRALSLLEAELGSDHPSVARLVAALAQHRVGS